MNVGEQFGSSVDPSQSDNLAMLAYQDARLPVDYISRFFSSYPDFNHDVSAPVWSEFTRMQNHFGWGSDDPPFRRARLGFKSAMVQQFNGLYGTEEDDLRSWQRLCRTLSIKPVPRNVKMCRKVVNSIV